MKTAIIIGSGFGALSLGIRLQADNWNVKIFEKNQAPGGHAQQFKKNGYTFDMGPSLITAPDILKSIFIKAGKDLNDYVSLVPLDPFYRVYFHDKSFIDYTGDSQRMINQMKNFNPQDADNYNKFIDKSKEIYKAVIEDGLGSTAFNNLGIMLKFIPRATKLNALLPAYSVASKYFEDFRHRFMFSFHPLFIGGNPFKVPSVYLMISYLEKAGGVWYTIGGMYSLVQAFVSVFKELGGELYTNSEVNEIPVKDGKAIGIISNDKFYEADIVISNADVTRTYSILKSKDESYRNGNVSGKYSMSAFLMFLGVKKKYPELLHHTIILSHRYKELVTDIFDRHILPDDFSMYVHVPSKTDPSMAPEGCDSIYILVPVTNLQAGVDWDKEKTTYGDKIINFLENNFGLEDFKNNIDFIDYFTPKDFLLQRNSAFGTPWGLEPVLTQTAYFRQHNQSKKIKNLFFVGAGTHPGAGLPGVMLSAEATEKLIKKYH
ncbi:MAG: phytoene desaturase family protein [Candidatus Kapabacteria bacterium]|nr:phytoene desaturase family protein [Candidatus Kapabacteria bacterium]